MKTKEDSSLMKKLLRILSGGVLLGAVSMFAAPLALGQDYPEGVTYTSVSHGNWISFGNMSQIENLHFNEMVDIPAEYQGARWDKTGDEFSFQYSWDDEQTEYTRFYPGAIKSETTLAFLANDNAVIDGHRIDIDFSHFENQGRHGLVSVIVGVNDLSIKNNGILNVNSGVLSVNGLLRVEQGSMINVNDGMFYSEQGYLSNVDNSQVINTGTFNINENSNGEIANFTNESTGRLNFNNFSETWVYDEEYDYSYATSLFEIENLANAGTVTLDNSSVTIGNYSGAGVLELKNGSQLAVYDGADFQLEDGHELKITGANNVIEGAGVNVTATDSKLNVTGSGSGTDSVVINGAVTFNGGTGTFNFQNVTAELSEAAYANFDTSETFDVNGGTTLGGAGFADVDFRFNSDSIHAPGNSPGVFQANTIAYENGSTVYIDIGGTTADVDKILAHGDIDFNDNVNVVLLNWGNHDADVAADAVFESQIGTINVGGDEIANATVGAVTDNKVEIDGENQGKITVSSAQYDGQDTLTINGVLVADDSSALGFDITGNTLDQTPGGTPPRLPSSNTMKLGNVVLGMQGTGLYNALGNYAGSDLAKLEAAVAQLDPTALSLGGRITHDAVSRFNRANFARMQRYQDARRFAPRYATGRFDDMLIRAQSCEDDCGYAVSCGSRTLNACDNREFWFEMLGSFANQSEQNGIAGYSADTIGFGVGVDRRFTRNFVGGFGFGGSFTKADMDRGLGSTSVDNYMFSLYGSYFAGPWTIKSSGGYAYSSLKSTRIASLINGYATGDRDADTWFASLELSRRFGCANRYLTPFYALDFIMYEEDGYTERGHLINMRVKSSDVDGYLQTLGLRFGTRWQHDNGWIFNPELTAGWIHDYGDGRISTSGQFVQGGLPFTVVGTSRNKDRALIGIGLNTVLSSRMSAFARYDGELANHFNSQTVQAGFNVTF